MGEEADSEDCDMAAQDGDGDEGRVLEWEVGLPSADDLIPLSQSLISPDLAYAFSIVPEPARTLLDVHRASQRTVSSLRRNSTSSSASAAALKFFSPFPSLSSVATDDPVVIDGEADDAENGITATVAATAGESSCLPPENSGDDHSNRALKRPRLVWTAQLHKRFIDVVAHLGIKNAVPKTIMQLMNVEGLTRENVASHLQKYRLYRKRMEGMPDEGLSSSDHFPHEPSAQMPTPYGAPPPTVPMSVFGIRFHPGHNGAMEMVPVVSHHQAPGVYRAFVSHHPNGEVIGDQQGDWSAGNKSGSIVSHPRAIPNDL